MKHVVPYYVFTMFLIYSIFKIRTVCLGRLHFSASQPYLILDLVVEGGGQRDGAGAMVDGEKAVLVAARDAVPHLRSCRSTG